MGDWIKSELARSYEPATKSDEARLARLPRAAKAHYDARKSRLVIELMNGVILMLPPKLLQGLKNATAAQLGKVELTPLGTPCIYIAWQHDTPPPSEVGISDQAVALDTNKGYIRI
jgi:hypothetical protein